jgi:hypothetical protein
MTLRLNIQKIISSIFSSNIIFNSICGNSNRKLPQSHVKQALATDDRSCSQYTKDLQKYWIGITIIAEK